MIDALQPTLARLRAAWAQSSLPEFFGWWGTQLRACLPPRLRDMLEERSEVLLLDANDGAITVYRSGRGAEALASIDRSRSAEEQRLALADARNQFEDPQLRMLLCLPRSRVLLRQLRLPAAAENNLPQVLGFEMDRQTPFKADQVFSDYRITARDPASKTISVELAVVPRPAMDADLERLESLEPALDGVDGWSDQAGSAPLGFNFLPRDRRVKRHNTRLRINLALAAVAVLLLLVAMNLWVANREHALAAMTDDVAALQKEAKQVTVLRKGLAESVKAASYLGRKKSTAPSLVAMVQEVTHALPDDTWLMRLSVNDGTKISLQGQSAHAAALIEKLSGASTLTSPSFQGVIQPDSRTGKERFNISATLASSKETDDAPPATAK